MAAVMIAMIFVMVLIIILSGGIVRLLQRWLCWYGLSRTLDNLVQFPSVQPNAAALRTKIDFNTLALCHLKRDITDGTFHNYSSLVVDHKKINKQGCVQTLNTEDSPVFSLENEHIVFKIVLQ